MAKAKFKPNKQKYVLELDEYEAKVLIALTGHISGSTYKTNRGVTDKIYYALDGILDLEYETTKALQPKGVVSYKDNLEAITYLMENK